MLNAKLGEVGFLNIFIFLYLFFLFGFWTLDWKIRSEISICDNGHKAFYASARNRTLTKVNIHQCP